MRISRTNSNTPFQKRDKKLNRQITKLNAHGLNPSAIGGELGLSLPVVKRRLRKLQLTSNHSTVRRAIVVRKLKPMDSLSKTARYLREHPKARAVHLETMRKYNLAHPQKIQNSVKQARFKNRQFVRTFYVGNVCGHSDPPTLDHVHEFPHPKCGKLHRLFLKDTNNDRVYCFAAAVIKEAPEPVALDGQQWSTDDFQLLCDACNKEKAIAAKAVHP
jgi:hypothetical protein